MLTFYFHALLDRFVNAAFQYSSNIAVLSHIRVITTLSQFAVNYRVIKRTCRCVWGHAVMQLFEALCYKPKARLFDSQRVLWISLIDLILPAALGPEVESACNRNEYQESSWG
jgi:hypothetical protein